MKRREFILLPSAQLCMNEANHTVDFCSEEEAQAAGFRKSYTC